MLEEDLISVILPVRNGEKYISFAVESVLTQSYKQFELLLINDGSTDGTLQIISAITDERVKIVNTDGIGLVNALNLGIQLAIGKYIARMDADDICMPERFEKQLEVFKNRPGIGVVCTDVELIDEQGVSLGFERHTIASRFELLKGLTFRGKMKPIVHPSVMMKKEFVDVINGYRKYKSSEDRDMWLRLYPETDFFRISTPLLKYRINSEGISKSQHIQQKSNAMLAILNYEVYDKLKVDLYIEHNDFLEHFEKQFKGYVLKVKSDFDAFVDFKNSVRHGSRFLRVFVLVGVIFKPKIIGHILRRRINDRREIKKALELSEKMLFTLREFNN